MEELLLWERGLAPVFSESQKDLVLERIFGMIGTSTRFYVEVGTQSGEQCNTRYLRVRYGFHGLMLDDNFRNKHVNLKRQFITPSNVVQIFQENNVPHHFDLLSLDTDGYEWLLWLKLNEAGYAPRVVVLEYGENLPYTEDVIIRHTTFPVHRLCLSQLQRFPKVSGASITSLLKLGRAWGYHLVHLVACGTSDLIFIRDDAMGGRAFPAQNDAVALCRLSAYQCEASEIWCATQWPGAAPPSEDKHAEFSTAVVINSSTTGWCDKLQKKATNLWCGKLQDLRTTAELALAGNYKLQRVLGKRCKRDCRLFCEPVLPRAVARGAVLAADLPWAAGATQMTTGSIARHSPACCSWHLAGRARDMKMPKAAEHLGVGPGTVASFLYTFSEKETDKEGEEGTRVQMFCLKYHQRPVLENERIETCYGDIAEFGGKGPETRRINAEGNSYLKSHYPRLSYIRRARPLDWTPPGGVEIIAEASPVPSRTTAQAAAREAQLRASEAGRSALLAAQAKDPEEAVRAAVTARHAAEAAQAAAEAAEAASAALLGAHGQSWRPPSPPRRSLAAPPGVASSSSNRSASLGSFRSSRSTLPFMIQRPGSTLHGLQSVRGNNSYVPNASLPSTPMWPQPVLPQVMAYVPQMASQTSLPLPNAQLPTQVSAQQLPPQQTQPSPQQMPPQQLPPQLLPPQQLPPQQLPPQQLPPQQLPPQQLPPQQLHSQHLPPQQLPFAQLLSQPASTPRQPGMAQMPLTHTSGGMCLSPQHPQPKLFL
ncbi:unnamed protein product [Symbiodinium sp. CCMP2456]|nr:unnamed protein product [Symbiodinium sp. CCMP2456]